MDQCAVHRVSVAALARSRKTANTAQTRASALRDSAPGGGEIGCVVSMIGCVMYSVVVYGRVYCKSYCGD